MFISRKEIIDEYCEWLFGFFFSLKDKIPYETMIPIKDVFLVSCQSGSLMSG
ncbi:DUF4422 domain-containing protein [Serratia marcescens]|uniref:DUF4422 domain-containing protein n=1 Tax=Serratia marcescens TaxID=615 RepID=A0A939NMG4_SERMA|nr:DUF4422 domain-containing protein [Serratia marcescens]